MLERCNHPLGSSENLAVMCGLPRDHEGPHRATLSITPPAPHPRPFEVWEHKENNVRILIDSVRGQEVRWHTIDRRGVDTMASFLERFRPLK